MAVTVVNDTPKNTATVSNDIKGGRHVTWDAATDTWAESEGTWDNPANVPMTGESKNNASVANETKN